MPCYDPPYDLPQMYASVVDPYVDTLREIDEYCSQGLQLPDFSFELTLALNTVRDMVHARFRDQKLRTTTTAPSSEPWIPEPQEFAVQAFGTLSESEGALTPADVLRREIASHQTKILWHNGQIEEYNAAIRKLERHG